MRVIALGASNLTRGLRTVASMSRAQWGRDTQVIAALGLGRSYGERSRLLVRSLPGIRQCGIWNALDAAPREESIGLISDVGNDILYGYPPERILEWVDEAITRLQRYTGTVVVAGLPAHSAAQLTPRRFRVMRAVMFPSSNQTFDGARQSVTVVQAGVERLAAQRGLRFVPMLPDWYGWDPIHFRYRYWRRFWGDMLGTDPALWTASPEPGGLRESVRLWLRADEHRWICGVHQYTKQKGRIQLF